MKSSENKWLCIWGGVIIAVATLGQLQRWQLTSNVAIYLQDVLLAGWLALWWWHRGRHALRTQPLLQPLLTKPWSIATGWVVLGWLVAAFTTAPGLELLRPLLYIIRLISAWTFARSLVSIWPKSENNLAKLGLTLAGGLVLLWGFIQYVWLPDTRFLKTFGWDDHYYRLISTLFDPGFTGLLLIMTSLGAIGWLSDLKPKIGHWWDRSHTWWLVGGGLAVTLGVLLTYSRASYLSFAIGLGWLAWQAQQQQKLKTAVISTLLILGLLIGIPFLPRPAGEGVKLERSSTVMARLTTITSAFQQLQPVQWVMGRGLFLGKTVQPGTLPDHAQLPDNLIVLFITGVGLGGCLIGLKLFAKPAWRWWQAQPVWLQGMWLAVGVHSLFNNSLFQPQIWLFLQLWTVFGRTLTAGSAASEKA